MGYKIKFDNFFSYSFSLDCVIFGYENGKIYALLIKFINHRTVKQQLHSEPEEYKRKATSVK